MTDTRPPVAPVEWQPSKDEPLTARQAIMQLDADIAVAKASHLAGDYTIMPTKLAEALIALVSLADAACDYADQHCRWFDISTAPEDGTVILVYRPDQGVFCAHYVEEDAHLSNYMNPPEGDCCWFSVTGDDLTNDMPTHWRPLPPPPSNPPLPAVFTELGQALEKIKGAG